MTSATDAISAVIASGRGSRPASLDNAEAEQVLAIALALLVELSASNQRIDRLEREVAALRGVALDDLKEAPLDAAAQAERQQAMEALQLRVMRIMIDPRAAEPAQR
jgi:hypothetical protein